MSETQLTMLVIAAWVGAAIGFPIPVLLGLLVAGGALFVRRPYALIIGVFVLALGLSDHAGDAYRPATASAVATTVQLTADPEPGSFTWSAEGKLQDGSRVRLVADRSVDISSYVVGETLAITGNLRPVADAPWLRVRHIVGQVGLESAALVDGVPWWMVPADQLRGWVTTSSASFNDDDAALYAGLVIGDDRFQSNSQKALFRAGGLTHLLAVSGQNVAFALAVAGPFLRRLGVGWRLPVVVVLLLVFALATRFEPSVLRATVTAGIGAWAVTVGRPASGVRTLCLAVTVLVLVDPFLVDSVGFQLSVGASAAILLCAPLVAERLRGPGFLVGPLAVTLAAQIGVAPIMMVTFGPVSLSSVPANLLAGPAAGFVMMWGLSVGVVAAWLPDGVGAVVQWPPGLMVRWIAGVAGWSARLPLPLFGWRSATLVVAFVVLWWGAVGFGRRLSRVWRFAAVGGVAVVSFVAVPRPPVGLVDYGGLVFVPSVDGSVSVLIVEGAARRSSLEGLIADRIRGVELVVTTAGGYSARQFVDELRGTVAVGSVLGPPLHQIRGVRGVDAVVEIPTAVGVLRIEPAVDRLHLTVELQP